MQTKALYRVLVLDKDGRMMMDRVISTRGASTSALRTFIKSTDGSLALAIGARIEVKSTDLDVQFYAMDLDRTVA